MSPEVYSHQARGLGLQKSLAERLFDVYDKHKAETSNSNPKEDPNVLFLTENYRCHKEILQFPSDNFYGEKLIARGNDLPEHPKYSPLLFFSARGKEKKEHDNSYINLSEVYEVAKRVKEIADSWPPNWGPKKLSDIAVLSSYRYQVKLEFFSISLCKWNCIFYIPTSTLPVTPAFCNGLRFKNVYFLLGQC